MGTGNAEIAQLLGDQEDTLERWFDSFLSTDETDLILAGGNRPEHRRIGEIFDRWFERSRGQLREVLCGRLGYGSLSEEQRNTGEIAVVAAAAAAISAASMPETVDPLLTAALLIGRQKLDGLCKGYMTPPSTKPG